VQDATVGGLRCTKCLNNLRVNLVNGRCCKLGAAAWLAPRGGGHMAG
jgi:hypothetical protein